MGNRKNKNLRYSSSLYGEIEEWEEEKLTRIRITDENDRFITFLDVRDCKNDEEIHYKMMKSFWEYCLSNGEKTYVALKKIIIRFPYFNWKEYNDFFEKILRIKNCDKQL